MVDRSRIRRWLIRAVTLAALALACVWLVLRARREEPIDVDVVRATRGEVCSTIVNTRAGALRARTRASIAPEIAGAVTTMAVERGQTVRRGELLLSLDDAVLRAHRDLAAAECDVLRSDLRHACIASEQAERELTRHRKLVDEGWESADALDHLKNERDLRASDCDTAFARVSRAEAQLAIAEAELARTVMLAPFDGVVAEVTVELGERVLPLLGSGLASGAVELYAPSTFHVVAPIDETDSGRVEPGLAARVTLDSRPGETFQGLVVAIAPYVLDIEEQNRTVEVEVELAPETLRGLLPGTSADVEIVVERAPDVLRIPTACVQPGDTVLVLDGNVLASRRFERGLWNWEWTEVRSGLDGNEWIVAPRGQSGLVDGAAARRRVDLGAAP